MVSYASGHRLGPNMSHHSTVTYCGYHVNEKMTIVSTLGGYRRKNAQWGSAFKNKNTN